MDIKVFNVWTLAYEVMYQSTHRAPFSHVFFKTMDLVIHNFKCSLSPQKHLAHSKNTAGALSAFIADC